MLTILVVLVFIILLVLLFGGNVVLRIIGGIGLALATLISAIIFIGGGSKGDKGQFDTLHLCKAAAAVAADVSLESVQSNSMKSGKLYLINYSTSDQDPDMYYSCSLDGSNHVLLDHKIIAITEPNRIFSFSVDGDELKIQFENNGKLVRTRTFQRKQFNRKLAPSK